MNELMMMIAFITFKSSLVPLISSLINRRRFWAVIYENQIS